MNRIAKLSVAALSVCLLVACESGDKSDATTQPAMGAVNDECPIMGGPIDASAGTAEYDGMTIGFCCAGCVGKWNGWSDDQKSAAVKAMK